MKNSDLHAFNSDIFRLIQRYFMHLTGQAEDRFKHGDPMPPYLVCLPRIGPPWSWHP